MFCKQVLALFFWCHCYQIVLIPMLQLLAFGHTSTNNFLELFGRNPLTTFSPSAGFFNDPKQQGAASDGSSLGGKSSSNNLYSSLLLYVAGSPITVEANPVALTPGIEFALRCNITEYPDEQFSWFRTRLYSNKEAAPAERIEEELKEDHRYIIQNNVIILKSPTFSDVGDYYCRVKNPHDEIVETEKMISVRARPYIHDFNIESATLISAVVEEGKSLKIPCNVVDDYVPESKLQVKWQMSKFDENDMNDVMPGEDGISIESYNSTSHALTIEKVTKQHRGFYKCHVTNGITDNSKVILIRVRDKYTVIWPTVGIVIELLILIGVICVVENRKVEPDKDIYDRKAIQM